MLQLYGTDALAEFRLKKLLLQLQQLVPRITALSATHIYFADSATQLFPALRQVLSKSLALEQTVEAFGQSLLVLPRPGTISPWSSKATDILHVCGLRAVQRIERGIVFAIQAATPLSVDELNLLKPLLHDRMTEIVLDAIPSAMLLFKRSEPKPLTTIALLAQGREALVNCNQQLGLALNEAEINYLLGCFRELKREPTDIELMMFAQANSEHCRHKIFNAAWTLDGGVQQKSLFAMIRNTYACRSAGILSAYTDNAAVIIGHQGAWFYPHSTTKEYSYAHEPLHIVIKVETHNHPTAIAPFPGAATGAGGEIRDEGATGRGAKPKAGLSGFSVSHLHLPGFSQAWEMPAGKPEQMAAPLTIMLEGPLGTAAYNNEFGRPNLCGYFRVYQQHVNGHTYGYHKPIMLAGGMGNIRANQINKQSIPQGAYILVLGGPAMLIGIGGGAASSLSSGAVHAELDFASVQRPNPEMQRRCQEVIDSCWQLGEGNPILSIHDVGAGGLSNAVPEIIRDCERGGKFNLREIPNAEFSMSPLQIWCNESQERYVLALTKPHIDVFKKIAQRERAPYAIIGEATTAQLLTLHDHYFGNDPIKVSMELLFGKVPKMHRIAERIKVELPAIDTQAIDLSAAVKQVLQHPTVADKSFLITIGDRSITGMVCRDQLVGPWQVAVADVAVTANSFRAYTGEAMALGERAPVAVINAAAAARMAVGEALTNLLAADIEQLSDINLSANWMAAAELESEAAALYDAVQAVGMELCPALGITIPVGKDSMSMRTVWQQHGETKTVLAPVSLIISAFSKICDVRRTLTPQLRTDKGATVLLLLDLGNTKNRLGASIFAQVHQQIGNEVPDIDAETLKNCFAALKLLRQKNHLIAYHDRSDGGLLATLCEMAFAGHVGVTINLPSGDSVAQLFTEELGIVIQIPQGVLSAAKLILQQCQISAYDIAHLNNSDEIIIQQQGQTLFKQPRAELQTYWSEVSYQLRALRDNPVCAEQEHNAINKPTTGLHATLSFDINDDIAAPYVKKGLRPRVAILREQGVNGHIEMAAAFERAGFACVDVHMSDILQVRVKLNTFSGLAACGGFSYGDVLGAGTGWANSILYNPTVYDEFSAFFARSDTFSLGVCNGCQMLSQLKTIIPGAEHWPCFERNVSEQFEARVSLVRVEKSASLFFADMSDSIFPIALAHGEGRVQFATASDANLAQVALRYVDTQDHVTENYPLNPSGSVAGVAALTSSDGRATIIMPHPERVFRTVTNSWHPDTWQEDAPTLRMFRNARKWVA